MHNYTSICLPNFPCSSYQCVGIKPRASRIIHNNLWDSRIIHNNQCSKNTAYIVSAYTKISNLMNKSFSSQTNRGTVATCKKVFSKDTVSNRYGNYNSELTLMEYAVPYDVGLIRKVECIVRFCVAYL